IYEITRKYPTSITIIENGEELKFKTSVEAQKFLNELFGDINYFKRFRMIDNSIGINFLEEGPQALKKILFSNSDEIFNRVKDRLNEMKKNREIYNKDKAVIYKISPSEKRLDFLNQSIIKVNQELAELKSEDQKLYREVFNKSNSKGQIEGQLKTAKWQKEQSEKSTHCYACKQPLLEETKKGMIVAKINEIKELEKNLKEVIEENEEINEIRATFQEPIENITARANKLKTLIMKLEGRLKQKDYIYTQRDVEVVKVALRELDALSTRYLAESLKILEPIINSVLEKIKYQVEFDVNDKGKFSITLYKEGVKYTYKDLSSGERLLLQIAFKLAILLEKDENGLILTDEGLSNLDQTNLLHVLDIFSNYPFQLVMVLHRCENLPSDVKIIDLGEIKNG
ncbi:hypothetical protein DRO38_05855, partial [Candidatus Bathyarchaeota archaeon]